MSEVSLYGLRPRARLGAWPSLLSQNGKYGCGGLRESTRRKKPKVPSSVLIALRNVLRPTIDKLFHRALLVSLATQLFIFVPKYYGSHPDMDDPTLRDGGSPYVATSVLEEMPFILERLNFRSPPPAFLLHREHRFDLLNGHLRMKPTRSQGCAQKPDHTLLPDLCQAVGIVVGTRDPGVRGPL
jgi:hypothetical protein